MTEKTQSEYLTPDAKGENARELGILRRLFRYQSGSADHATRFKQWIGSFFLFSGLAAVILILTMAPTAIWPISVVMGPVLALIAFDTLSWLRVRQQATADITVIRFRKWIYYSSYFFALYIGLAAAWLLTVYTAEFLPHLLVWQIGMGIAIGALSGTNALQYGVRLLLTMLPIGLLLFQTGDPKYSGLMVLSYLVIFLVTLIKLATSETLYALEKKHQTINTQRSIAEYRLASLLRETNDCAWQTNRHHQLAHLSENFERITGQKIATILERQRANDPNCFGDAIAVDQHANLSAALRARIAFDNLEVALTTREKKTLWFAIHGTPEFQSDGTFTGFRGWAIDISSTIQAREKLRRYDEVLEQKVAFRTAQLDEKLKQMKQADQQVQSRTIARLQLLHSVSGAVNRSVRSMASDTAILRTNIDKDVCAAADEINLIGARLSRAVANVTGYFEATENDKPTNEKVIGVDDLIRQSVSDAAQQAKRKSVNLVVDALCGEQLFASFAELHKALVEVLVNAIIASPDNGDVTLKVGSVTKGLTITISDKGSPVSAQMRKCASGNVSIDHDTADQTSAAHHTGAVLGMAIAAHLVMTHGGHIDVLQPSTDDAPTNRVMITLPRTRLMTRSNF